MSRPFMLYHWAPVARRRSILRHGLVPGKRSVDGSWRPPYLCFAKFPTVAWALSATHSRVRGEWDLWCVWSDRVGLYITRNATRTQWHWTEYRSKRRIAKAHVWHVGTREFVPRRRRQPE